MNGQERVGMLKEAWEGATWGVRAADVASDRANQGGKRDAGQGQLAVKVMITIGICIGAGVPLTANRNPQ